MIAASMTHKERDKLDDVDTIRNVFDVLFSRDAKLRTLLCDAKLWNAWQDRNLIVHRRAVVDEDFLRKTAKKVEIGSVLKITPYQFEATLRYFTETGSALLVCYPN